MGCFNVAGSMSNLSLGCGDRIVFFPIGPNRYAKDKATASFGPESMMVSNVGASVVMEPKFLPIFGEYDDYGGVEEIERDANVEAIEAHFGITIDEFMTAVTRGHYDGFEHDTMAEELKTELKNMSGMFESREVYDEMVRVGKDYTDAYKSGYLSSSVLRSLGFVQDKDNTEYTDNRYNMHYEHPNIPQLAFASDGTWSHAYNTETKKQYPTPYHLQYLNRLLHQEFDIELADVCPEVAQYKGVSEIKFKLDAEVKKIEDDKRRKAALVADENMNPELHAILMRDSFDLFNTPSNRVLPALKYAYESSKLTDALVDMLCFDRLMFSTNNYYAPGSNGEQHGNVEASKALYDISLKVMADKEARYDKDNEPWEDDIVNY